MNLPDILNKYKRLIVFLLIFLALWAVFNFAYGNGRLFVKNFSSWNSVGIRPWDKPAEGFKPVKSGSLTLPAGDYVLELSKNSSSYYKEVQIRRFLATTAVDIVAAPQAAAEKIAYDTKQQLYRRTNNSLVSFEPIFGGTQLIQQGNEPFGQNNQSLNLSELGYNFFQKSNSSLIGYSAASDNVTFQLALYDLNTGNLKVVGPPQASFQPNNNSSIILKGSDYNKADFMFYSPVSGLVVFRSPDFNPQTVNIRDLASMNGPAPLVVLGGNKLLGYQGPVLALGDSAVKPPAPSRGKISLYDLNASRLDKTFILPMATLVTSISLSPSGTNAAIGTSQGFWLLSGQSGKFERLPLQGTSDRLQWIDDNSFVYLQADQGLYVYETSNGVARPILSNPNLRMSDYTIQNNKTVLLSAYPNSMGRESVLVGYQLDLTKPQTASQRAAITNLPVSANDYKIDTVDGNKIYIIPRVIVGNAVSGGDSASNSKQAEAAKNFLSAIGLKEPAFTYIFQ